MTIVSIKSGADPDIRRIEFSDGSLFSFKIYYLPPDYTMTEGMILSPAQEAGFRFAAACMRAEKAALQLIARAEQTAFGLSRKLQKRGHDRDCVCAVVARLCETGLLDDCRYSRLWIESRIACRVSTPRRLLAALRARGIDRRDAEQALQAALDAETEQRLLEGYVRRQHRRIACDNSDAARRTLRYLLKNEGFSSTTIQIFFDNNESLS